MTLQLIALPVQPLLEATLRRYAARYVEAERTRTIQNWDTVEAQLSAIVNRVPSDQRRTFRQMIREERAP